MGVSRCIVIGMVGLVLVPSTVRADDLGALGWPATTTAAVARYGVRVLDAAHGKRIGAIAPGSYLTWKQIVPATDGCRAWIELAPRGWVCGRELTPTDKPAEADAKPPEPARWAAVRPTEGTDAFDSLDAIKAATPSHHVGEHTYVAIRATARTLVVDGTRYTFTDQGFLPSDDLVGFGAPSPYVGLELAPKASLAFGWAVARLPGRKITVRDAANAKAVVVRQLAPRDVVTIEEIAGDYARIGAGEWVDAVELRKPALAARPAGVDDHERWIDVDLDQQVLLAYEGDVPVFATVVSTGRIDWQTPTGIYRIRGKEAKTRMQDPGNMAESWNVADVPWSMRFRKNFALHGTYWHDGFGRQRSHGCVNLSTGDAKRLWDFVTPTAPASWIEVEAEGPGTAVRIHSARDPDPKWLDYDGRTMTTLPKPTTASR